MERITFQVDTASNITTPNYKQVKSIFEKIDKSYELYELSESVGAGIDFLVSAVIETINLLSVEPYATILNLPEVKQGLSELIFHFAITHNAFGVVTVNNEYINNKLFKIPKIKAIPAHMVRKLSNGQIAVYIDNRRLANLLRKKFDQTISKEELKLLESIGNFNYLERPVDKVDLFALPQDLKSEAEAKIKQLFVIKEAHAFKFSAPSPNIYASPLLFKFYPLFELRNAILNSEISYYKAASWFLFVLKTGRENESKKIIEQQLNVYMEALQNIDLSGVLGVDSSTSIDIVTGRKFGSSPSILNLIKLIDIILFYRTIGIEANPALDELAGELKIATASFKSLINNVISLIRKLNNLPFEQINYPPLVITSKDASKYIRFRDRGDISRTTAIKALGLNIEQEASLREKELLDGIDEKLIPPFVPWQGRERSTETKDFEEDEEYE